VPASPAGNICIALTLTLAACAIAQTQPVSEPAAIETARKAALAFIDALPDFIVNRTTTRYRVVGKTNSLPLDTVSGNIATVHGREVYSNIVVNGKPAAALPSRGIWSQGEFSSALLAVLSPDCDALFVATGQGRIRNRRASDFSFAVDQAHSRWSLPAVPADGSHFQTAFDGTLSLDSENGQVLRIVIVARDLPEGYPSHTIESTIDYDLVKIADASYVLPVRSDLLTCQQNGLLCFRNVSVFRDYKKFASDTSLTFEQ
jgi:hypothetical protein